ncbi:hypothetical protein Ae717Ps2_5164 [Pseudonocardia sp. Ae717_Ps2]|nr:hypothetical protein Ae717Ps2_5164 [Pseudonocardia sp. Ae717_Ps2]
MSDPTYRLLRELAGRVDDDLLATGRELVAVGEEGHALELLVAELVAGRAVLPHAVRSELVTEAAARRVQPDADACLPPAADVAAGPHRFDGDGPPGAAEAVAAALAGVPDPESGWTLAWRTTPAGAAPGPLPQPVLLARTGPHDAPEVLTYQAQAALARAGLVVSVEVGDDSPDPDYHRAAREVARPLPAAAPLPAAPPPAAPLTAAPLSAAPPLPAAASSAPSHDTPSHDAPSRDDVSAEGALPTGDRPAPPTSAHSSDRALGDRPDDRPSHRAGLVSAAAPPRTRGPTGTRPPSTRTPSPAHSAAWTATRRWRSMPYRPGTAPTAPPSAPPSMRRSPTRGDRPHRSPTTAPRPAPTAPPRRFRNRRTDPATSIRCRRGGPPPRRERAGPATGRSGPPTLPPPAPARTRAPPRPAPRRARPTRPVRARTPAPRPAPHTVRRRPPPTRPFTARRRAPPIRPARQCALRPAARGPAPPTAPIQVRPGRAAPRPDRSRYPPRARTPRIRHRGRRRRSGRCGRPPGATGSTRPRRPAARTRRRRAASARSPTSPGTASSPNPPVPATATPRTTTGHTPRPRTAGPWRGRRSVRSRPTRRRPAGHRAPPTDRRHHRSTGHVPGPRRIRLRRRPGPRRIPRPRLSPRPRPFHRSPPRIRPRSAAGRPGVTSTYRPTGRPGGRPRVTGPPRSSCVRPSEHPRRRAPTRRPGSRTGPRAPGSGRSGRRRSRRGPTGPMSTGPFRARRASSPL